MEFFVKVAVIFIFIAYPILLFVNIWDASTYIIVFYFIWMGISLIGTILVASERFSDSVIGFISIVLISLSHIAFTVIFAKKGCYGTIWADDNPIFKWITPSLCLPAIVYIGITMGPLCDLVIETIEDRLRKLLKKCVIEKIDEISEQEVRFKNYNASDKSIKSLVQLMDTCSTGHNLKILYDNIGNKIFKSYMSEVKAVALDENVLKNKENFECYIEQQAKQKVECKKILNGITYYKYKELKKLYKKYKKGGKI